MLGLYIIAAGSGLLTTLAAIGILSVVRNEGVASLHPQRTAVLGGGPAIVLAVTLCTIWWLS